MSAADNTSQRYVRWQLGALGLALLVVVVINAVVDPFGVTGLNRLGIYSAREREYKEVAVHREPHDAVIVSHSRLSAQDPRLLEGHTFFNMAVGGGRLEELWNRMEAAPGSEDLVILGVDFWMFNGVYWPWDPKPPNWITPRRLFLRYLLNWTYFLESIRTVRNSVAGKEPVVEPPGFLNAAFWEARGETDPDLQVMAVDSIVEGYVYEPRRMELLRTMKQVLEERGVRLQVFLHPESPILRSKLERDDLRDWYTAWRLEMEEIFPDLVDLTDSEYSVEENYYTYDPVHYKPEVSTEFLNREVIPRIIERRGSDEG